MSLAAQKNSSRALQTVALCKPSRSGSPFLSCWKTCLMLGYPATFAENPDIPILPG